MTNVLEQIVVTKRKELAAAQAAVPMADLEVAAASAEPPRDFLGAIAADGPIKLIAEVKKASPSKGVIREDFHPVEIAKTYQQHGATCISVLTDQPYFQGSLDYLRDIRTAVELPLLRKDFILDVYQLFEARAAGADAVLLIAECLDDRELGSLLRETDQLGMTALVEFYSPENLPRVLKAGAKLIGVNNRDLRTFKTDLQHSVRMRRQVPTACPLVGESGIHSHDDARLLQDAGVNAMLVGEHLMSQQDIGQAVDRLLGKG